MKIQLANVGDKQWWSEGGASSWGFGIDVTRYGSAHWDEATDTEHLESEGWLVAILLGPWSLIFHTEAAFKSSHGPDVSLYKTFEVVRP